MPIVISDRVIGVLTIESPDLAGSLRRMSRRCKAWQPRQASRSRALGDSSTPNLWLRSAGKQLRHLDLEAFLDTLFTRLKAVFEDQHIPTYMTWARYDKAEECTDHAANGILS